MYYNRAKSVNVSSRPHSSSRRQPPGGPVVSSAERVQCSATVNPGKGNKKGKEKKGRKKEEKSANFLSRVVPTLMASLPGRPQSSQAVIQRSLSFLPGLAIALMACQGLGSILAQPGAAHSRHRCISGPIASPQLFDQVATEGGYLEIQGANQLRRHEGVDGAAAPQKLS